MEIAKFLRTQAENCRRLADDTANMPMALNLRNLALEFEARAQAR